TGANCTMVGAVPSAAVPGAACRVPRAGYMHSTVVITGRGEERLRSGHPWIYRSDVAEARAGAGDVVIVRGPRGRTLGLALYSSHSQIAIRMLERGQTVETIDVAALLRTRIESAIA